MHTAIVVQLGNSSGVVTKNYLYDAFGNEKNIDEADINPFRYPGEYLDLETNTYYLRARNYDPTTGRFLVEDSVQHVKKQMLNGQYVMDSLSLNLYTYCYNNPIRFIDPSGHITKEEQIMFESGKMSPGAYSYLMDLTYKWYLVDTKTSRDYFHGLAEEFRGTGYSKTGDSSWDSKISSMSALPTTSLTQEQHYFRNQLNIEFSWADFQKLDARLPDNLKWDKLPWEQSVFHKIGQINNRKYVSSDGHFEVVYTKENYLVNERFSEMNMGTYNYYGPDKETLHTKFDVNPYLQWDNTFNQWKKKQDAAEYMH